jgi:hypothetical protein
MNAGPYFFDFAVQKSAFIRDMALGVIAGFSSVVAQQQKRKCQEDSGQNRDIGEYEGA